MKATLACNSFPTSNYLKVLTIITIVCVSLCFNYSMSLSDDSYLKDSTTGSILQEEKRKSMKKEKRQCTIIPQKEHRISSLIEPKRQCLSKRRTFLKLDNVKMKFVNGYINLAKIISDIPENSIGMSFSVVQPDRGKWCDSCIQFFEMYSETNISKRFSGYGISIDADGSISFDRYTRKRDAEYLIFSLFFEMIRTLKSIDKLCFEYYMGPFKGERSKQGRGVFRNRDGFTYYGEFSDNHFHGYGSLMSTGCIHQGCFINNFLEGINEVIDKSNHYVGNMSAGYASGLGWKNDHGKTYVSQFERGRVAGTTLRIVNRSDFYLGQYKNGYGYSLGYSSIEGEYHDGKINGYCAQTNANGSLYFGDCVCGKPNGYGLAIYPLTRVIYMGEWNNGRWHGKGIKKEYKKGKCETAEGHFEQYGFVSNDNFHS